MAILVVYDISDDKTRTKVANKLELMGYKRIQRSVWILPLGCLLYTSPSPRDRG